MYAYPARTGSFGRWSFSPTDHTCSDDAREIYYDRNALSAFNNKPGRWITLNGGRRFRGASWAGQAPPPPLPPPPAPPRSHSPPRSCSRRAVSAPPPPPPPPGPRPPPAPPP